MATFETTLRYKNLNDRDLVENNYELYDSVLIQAHLLAYSKKAVPLLIRDMAEERSFNYYIDPMISDFRIGTNFRDSDGDVRGWHNRYVDILSDPLKEVLDENPNADASLLDDDAVRGICESIVEYQENFIYDRLREEAGKYEKVSVEPHEVQPKAVIPWVHKIERVEDTQTCRQILTHTQAAATISLKPCIYTTTGFARDTTNRTQLTKLLGEFDVKECFLVFEELKKYETSESEYKTVIDLVYDLYQSGVKPHFYYGDFFANLLSYFGLGGMATSSLYDEEFTEKLEYSGGGGLPARYYLDEVKDFLKVTAAVDIMNRVDAPMCDCGFCEKHFDTWQDLAAREESEDALKPILKKHRMALRWRHSRLIEENNLEDVLDELEDDFLNIVQEYSASPMKSPSKQLDYLPKWINAVRDRETLAVEELGQLQFV
ncbi:hypothetical protein D320_06108 [Haloferax sp. BAB-2207]|nr:hypothetical protein [Haloferax sp. BAB-2207]ELK55160.1 hypothetical protein D320_06108 [Haloferax sp. BAB-2207]